METAKRKYERRERNYNRLLQKQERAEKRISNLRLAVFTIGSGIAVYMHIIRNYILFALGLAVSAAIFFYLVAYHQKLSARAKFTTLLRDINISSLKRMKGEWNSFQDDGEDFKDDSHSYSSDLDIYGKNSLFQWINTSNTFVGRHKLRELLSGVIGDCNDIIERQEAVNELAAKLNWRQRFSAEGMISSKKMCDPIHLTTWAGENIEIFQKPWVIALVRIFPAITILLILTGFGMSIIPWHLPSGALLAQFVLISYKGKERYRTFNICENYNNDLKTYYRMLTHLEKHNFKSAHIKKIKEEIKSSNGSEAFKQIEKLSSIIDSVSDRNNLFYFLLNILTLWDFQCIIALERWKKKSGHFIKEWLDALGRMEALASLAVIRFENPDWVIPTVRENTRTVLEAKGMGHPLLTGNRVCNDLTVNENDKILLITGSNMSGKSTLLRTAGINLVLAYAGAPVCARFFRASIMEIHTCMRVSDNLEENISSFYAEILRIKRIVKEAESGKKVFFLLDEIFKGTNSLDRHTGASILINKLSTTSSFGLVSTHDLELCRLEKENDRIVNYHFQEFYKAGKIHFDYKLRPGASTTRNALYLMRMAGIIADDEISR